MNLFHIKIQEWFPFLKQVRNNSKREWERQYSELGSKYTGMFLLVPFWVSIWRSSEIIAALTNEGLHRYDLVSKCFGEAKLGLFCFS